MRRLRTHVSASLLLLAVFGAGCVWRTIDEQQQVQAQSFVRLVGRTAGTAVSLAGKRQYSFTIEEDADQDGKRYAVDPGNYRLTVRRGEEVVVDRKLFLADGETCEVRVR